MSRPTIFTSVLLAFLIAMMTPAPAGASTYDKLTYLTFSGPVQVPGVTLDAGTYRFRLTNPDTSRNVMQVLSHDGQIVYAMFHTTFDSRMEVTDNANVTFRETPAGVPPAVKSLFYGGEHRGYEFMYPRGGPIMVAPVAPPQPAITYAPAIVPAPEAVVGTEPEVALEPEAEVVTPTLAEPVAAPPAEELPRTASPLPFVVFSGLSSLVLGLGAGLLRRRLH